MIHPSVRNFSWQTTCEVTAWSRSKFWRYSIKIPTVGRDILDFIRGRRALDELPPLSEIEEAHVLAALEAVESAHLTKIAEKKVENAKSDIDREVAA